MAKGIGKSGDAGVSQSSGVKKTGGTVEHSHPGASKSVGAMPLHAAFTKQHESDPLSSNRPQNHLFRNKK